MDKKKVKVCLRICGLVQAGFASYKPVKKEFPVFPSGK